MRNYPYNQEFYKKTGYKVTEEVISRYDEFGVDVSELLEEDYYLVFKNMPGIISRLEKHVADYPNIPSFKNYLYIAYSQNGKKLKAQRLLEETIALHPEYVFAYLNKANLYIEQKKPKEALKLLGPNLQISDLVKDGEVYHFSEFLAYQGTVCRTQLALDMDLEIVEERHKTMFWLDPDHNETRRAGLEIVMAQMERGIGNMHKKMGEMIEVESFPTVAFPQGNIRTPLHHAELEAFYKFGEEDLPKKIIEKILQLPRASLIEDLEKILEDGIKRFYHFRNNNEEFDESGQSFMIHALYFLGAIEAEESLQVVLNLMRQGEEFLDYWFADSLHDYFYPTLFALGKNQLEALKNYVLEDNQFYVTRLTAVSVVTQVALHFPERKEEVKKWFQEVYEYLLAHRKNKNLIDTHFIGWSVTELAQLRAVDMFPIVETLFHKGWVPEIIDGDLEEIKKGFLLEPEPADLFPFPKDIYEYYSGENQNRALERTVDTELLKGFDPAYNDYLMNLFLGPSEDFFERDDEEDDDDWEFPPYEPIEPIKRVGPKVGRNDPCPCGSGKKYKKCCLNK